MLEDYASLCEEYSNHQITHQQQQVIDFSPFEEDPSEINQHVCYKPCNKLLLLYLNSFWHRHLWLRDCYRPDFEWIWERFENNIAFVGSLSITPLQCFKNVLLMFQFVFLINESLLSQVKRMRFFLLMLFKVRAVRQRESSIGETETSVVLVNDKRELWRNREGV